MSRSFDVVVDSPASVERLHAAALSGADYWLARLAMPGVRTTLDLLTVDADDTVTVSATQRVGRHLLPGLVGKVVPGDLRIVHRETWRPVGDGRLLGQVDISASGAPNLGRGRAWLAPAGSGSRLRFAATVEVKIRLVGGMIENLIAAQLAENIAEVQRFTATWVTDRDRR